MSSTKVTNLELIAIVNLAKKDVRHSYVHSLVANIARQLKIGVVV